MSATDQPAQTRTHRSENFPVASLLIAPRHRTTILAFYRFARGADDIADSPTFTADEKIARLDAYEATLLGKTDAIENALPLRAALAERKLSSRHASDLLRAFRMDAAKTRYATWDELMHYCAYSAAPVGRFVLDVHGEAETTWPASDALCSALQVINHIQDCAADHRNLDRVYIPLDAMARAGTSVEALSAAQASPALRACLRDVTHQTASLVARGAGLPGQVRDLRLCLETAVISHIAETLTRLLLVRDPLSERVHLTKGSLLGVTLAGMLEGLRSRTRRRTPLSPSGQRGL